MTVTRRELLKSAAGIGVLGGLPQALRGTAHAQTTQKKELVTAQAGDIAKFDPHFSTASQDIRVSFNLFDNLTSRHPDGKLYQRTGKREQAQEHLTTATTMYREMGMTYWVEKTEAEMKKIAR